MTFEEEKKNPVMNVLFGWCCFASTIVRSHCLFHICSPKCLNLSERCQSTNVNYASISTGVDSLRRS